MGIEVSLRQNNGTDSSSSGPRDGLGRLVEKRQPLKSGGHLDNYKQIDITPVIGTEFPDANLLDWITAPNADELLRDLAIKISERGVVFFRAQDDLTNDVQKRFIQRLGELTGKPSDSGLHIHPVFNSERDQGGSDPEISTISSEQRKRQWASEKENGEKKDPEAVAAAALKAAAAIAASAAQKRPKQDWHSDIPFEPVPADYSSLRLVQLPRTGGDTLWASGYEIYDRLSGPYRRFLESLTATFAQPGFNAIAARAGFELYEQPRGSPHNVGSVLEAIHPVVRTNPVTGWQSIFPIGQHVARINDVTEGESEELLGWFQRLLIENHDLQVRFKWTNKNDIAIWDNRSVFHSATFDYDGQGERFGNRAVGVGERPYFDAQSRSRREALTADGKL